MAVDVAPGTVVVYTDVVCAWSTVALQRFHAARSRLDLDERVRVDHRLYLLEDVDSFAIPMRMLQAEIPVVGRLEPDLDISPWRAQPSDWPVSALPADEVQGSPHFSLADGSDVHDPGISLHWADAGCPVVDEDDPGVYDDLVRRAADAADRVPAGS